MIITACLCFTVLLNAQDAKCTSGNCENGKGTMEYFNGNKYVGDWKDGKKNGMGTEFYDQGCKYTGQFKNGRRHGKGTYSSVVHGKKWTGQWQNGMPVNPPAWVNDMFSDDY